jgi:peptide/nickel transport system substrate-binding protein
VPTYPPRNPDESPLEAKGLVYPYSTAKAVRLLRDHGWKVVPRGISYCSKPGAAAGDCGAGVKQNQPMTLSLIYPSGNPELNDQMDAMQSTMKMVAGINLEIKQEPVNTVTAEESAGCTTASPCSDWELSTEANTGVSWVYTPDYFPTGEETFVTGADSNHGDYSSSEANALIEATETAPSSTAETAALYAYEDYLARQLPEAWFPTAPYQLTIYKHSLKGLVPQGIYCEIYPQDYSFSR